jgi:hypothetical protein
MRMADPGVPYISDADIATLRAIIMDKAGATDPVFVDFVHGYESVFFINELPDHVRILYPIRTTVRGDLAVIRLSRYIPTWVQGGLIKTLERLGGGLEHPDYQRDETEMWYVVAVESR